MKKNKRCILALLGLTFFFCRFLYADDNGNSLSPFSFFIGEDLLYNVRYSFISLGSVRMKTLGTIQENGVTLYKMQSFIDSYSGVPFVDLHVIYESHIDEQGFPHHFIARTQDKEKWNYVTYDFNNDVHKIVIRKGVGTREDCTNYTSIDTIFADSSFQDGLSIFFYARRKSGKNGYEVIPTFQDQKKSTTEIDFTEKIENTDISALDNEISTKFMDGKANFIGVFGLTGGFRGWFSDDAERVPIIAKLNVLVGSVTLELKEWKHGNWNPPKGKDD